MESGWKVIVADELAITRRAVTTALRQDSDLHEVIECGTTEAALNQISQMETTLLLVDLHSPGLELVVSARQQHPGLKIVVLAGYDLPEDALSAMKAGADGFLVKGIFPEELMRCLHSVVDTGVVVTSRVLKKALISIPTQSGHPLAAAGRHPPLDEAVTDLLTMREREIFELMARNRSNKEIAATLHIAEQTVKAHVSRILTKLGQPNRAQAVIAGLRTGRPEGRVVDLRGTGRG